MNFFKHFTVVLSIALSACSGSDGTDTTDNPDNPDDTEEPHLVLAFDQSPLQPIVFNIVAPDQNSEQDFNPGEKIRTAWFMTLRYSDGSVLAADEHHLYDAAVYLSNDDLIDADDLTLFSLECSFPETADHTCGRFASFITDYAPDNTNTFSTTSIPLDRSKGLTDFSVDSTAFLDYIPMATNVIIKACLREVPDTCDQFIIGINLQ